MHLQTENLTLQVRDGIPKLRLQVRPGASLKQAPLKRLFGTTLPDNPQENTDSEQAIYWLSPNDWLLLNPPADPDSIKTTLQNASSNATCAVTDVSDAWSIIDLSGAAAPATLAQGCSVDFHDSAFPPGHYTLTRLHHHPTIIHRYQGSDHYMYLILLDNSSIHDLISALEDAFYYQKKSL